MSARVLWEPIKKPNLTFDVPAPSAFGEVMRKRFGVEPWEVSKEDIPWMQGIRDGGNTCAEWDEIIAAVERHGAVRIWREH